MMLSSSSSPYYSLAAFVPLVPVAVVYSLTARLLCRLPFVWSAPEVVSLPPPSTITSARRVALITGSNTGIGLETARTLVVDHGYEVILACRSRDKAEQAVEMIHASRRGDEQKQGQAVFVHPLDLGSLASVREFAGVIKERYDGLNVLILNAGMNAAGQTSQHDGLDLCFQTNYVGHFLLTQELMALILKSEKPRIVNVSSVMHHFCGGMGDLEAIEFWKHCAQGDNPTASYAASKLAALLFSVELNQRYRGKLLSIAVNPGSVNSDIWRDFPTILKWLFGTIYLNNQEGSTTSVAAAVGEFAETEETLYLEPYWMPGRRRAVPLPFMEMLGPFQGPVITQPRLPADGGVKAAQALWQASEELVAAATTK